MPGLGTLINVLAILVGTAVGVGMGDRLDPRYRAIVTDVLGLMTLVIAAIGIASIRDAAYTDATGFWATLIVLAALIIGALIGTALRLESRLEEFGQWLRRRLTKRAAATQAAGVRTGTQRPAGSTPSPSTPITGSTPMSPSSSESRIEGREGAADALAEQSEEEHAATARFVNGFVTASLIFCIGPLAVLGSLSDGMGTGISPLVVKSVMDGFICIALAAALGWGVGASAIPVALVQGSITVLGATLGSALSPAQIAGLTATGGVILIGVAFRLLQIKDIPVGDLLPALILAPTLVALVEIA